MAAALVASRSIGAFMSGSVSSFVVRECVALNHSAAAQALRNCKLLASSLPLPLPPWASLAPQTPGRARRHATG
jgi:hypothetical protein